MRYELEYSDISGRVTIIDNNKNFVLLHDLLEIEIEFLEKLVSYANFGIDIETSAEGELDTSDINNFIE